MRESNEDELENETRRSSESRALVGCRSDTIGCWDMERRSKERQRKKGREEQRELAREQRRAPVKSVRSLRRLTVSRACELVDRVKKGVEMAGGRVQGGNTGRQRVGE